jgi:hypothetical protein
MATVLGTTPALSANGGGSFDFTVPSAQGVGSYSLALILLHGTTELSRTAAGGSVARTVGFTAPAAGWGVAPGGPILVSWSSNVPASDATTTLSLYLVSAVSPSDVGTLLTTSAVVSAGSTTASVDASQVDGSYVLRAELDGQTVLSAAGTVATPPSASSAPVSETAHSWAETCMGAAVIVAYAGDRGATIQHFAAQHRRLFLVYDFTGRYISHNSPTLTFPPSPSAVCCAGAVRFSNCHGLRVRDSGGTVGHSLSLCVISADRAFSRSLCLIGTD